MKCGSCFSGIGLLDEGLRQAGIDHAWGCEHDPWRAKIWETRFQAPCHPDIRRLTVRLTDEQFASAVTRYQAGESLAMIAETLPCGRQALWQRMKTAKVEMRPNVS